MKVMAQGAYQWQSTQETIDDLVGKISVKRRDNESIFRNQQETIKRNEGKLFLNFGKGDRSKKR